MHDQEDEIGVIMILTYKDRYINNRLLSSISWPQYTNTCHLTTITAVFNYLFSQSIGIKSVEEVERTLDLGGVDKLAQKSDIGNQTLMDWYCVLCSHYDLPHKTPKIYFKEKLKRYENNSSEFSKLKLLVKREDAALVYHMENHYNLLIGYFEGATEPVKSYVHNSLLHRWVVLGDHSTYIDDYTKGLLDKASYDAEHQNLDRQEYDIIVDLLMPKPIWVRRWGSIRSDISENYNHCIILFEK